MRPVFTAGPQKSAALFAHFFASACAQASRTLLAFVERVQRAVIGATTKLLTAAERLQYEGHLRREETNAAILALSKNGIPIKQIVLRTGHSRSWADT